jgi:hypothetical protein
VRRRKRKKRRKIKNYLSFDKDPENGIVSHRL